MTCDVTHNVVLRFCGSLQPVAAEVEDGDTPEGELLRVETPQPVVGCEETTGKKITHDLKHFTFSDRENILR